MEVEPEAAAQQEHEDRDHRGGPAASEPLGSQVEHRGKRKTKQAARHHE